MNLIPRTLVLKRILVKDNPVLALDPGVAAESIEGLRLVKASRGTGWFYHGGKLSPWTTRGVIQEAGKLVVWGDLGTEVPETGPAGDWLRTGEPGLKFLRAFVSAWTARAGVRESLSPFSPSAVVPSQVGDQWSFAFLPDDLRSVLDSIHPLADRLAWDHFRHTDLTGASSWAFATAAFLVDGTTGTLPWAQDDEAYLRQEIRDLKRTLSRVELPAQSAGADPKLWYESLTDRLGPAAATRWKAWAEDPGTPAPGLEAPDPGVDPRALRAAVRRTKRRSSSLFWRQNGTKILLWGGSLAVVLAIAGSMIWGIVKPDPTDNWTPEQVVWGYYTGLRHLDTELLRKLTSYDRGKEKAMASDQDLVASIYVVRQVQIGYARKDPIVDPEGWLLGGRRALSPGEFLFGATDLEVHPDGDQWTVKYRFWESTSVEAGASGGTPVQGREVSDRLSLVKTWKGWKVGSIARNSQPLP